MVDVTQLSIFRRSRLHDPDSPYWWARFMAKALIVFGFNACLFLVLGLVGFMMNIFVFQQMLVMLMVLMAFTAGIGVLIMLVPAGLSFTLCFVPYDRARRRNAGTASRLSEILVFFSPWYPYLAFYIIASFTHLIRS